MENNKISEFPVIIYNDLQKVNQVLSKGRCRIFYKYDNRNGTYITDEFAEKLIQSLPYTPVKGIYDNFNDDYTDHGKDRSLGRIYGIVPEDPNFAWETHKDEDGVNRIYACADVYIFTALYEEANEIIGKSQSMELYKPSIKGEWALINGKKLFKFEEGCFLGLQVLGNDIEPCFEGAAFFSLYNTIKDMVKQLEKYTYKGGKSEMAKLNFKLSDSQKHDAIWSLLNDSYNEENNWVISYSICEIYDDYALAFNYETGSYERIYYTKNNETDSIEINERKKCYVIDVTESELNALNSLRAFNGGTYEAVDTVYSSLKEENENYKTKNEENEISISTLTTERDEARQNYQNAEQTISNLNSELETLKEYKLNVLAQEKEQVLASYEEMLGEEVLSQYREKIGEYADALSLDKELAYELKCSNPTVFSKDPKYVPKDMEEDGLIGLLNRYKQKN